MRSVEWADNWKKLAEELGIILPKSFIGLLFGQPEERIAWKFLSPADALTFKAELDLRYDYPGREWQGVPFARSTVSEDIVCFDLTGARGTEALVVPVRNWHGPRWEYAGERRTFDDWFTNDREGYLT